MSEGGAFGLGGRVEDRGGGVDGAVTQATYTRANLPASSAWGWTGGGGGRVRPGDPGTIPPGEPAGSWGRGWGGGGRGKGRSG